MSDTDNEQPSRSILKNTTPLPPTAPTVGDQQSNESVQHTIPPITHVMGVDGAKTFVTPTISTLDAIREAEEKLANPNSSDPKNS